MLDRKAFLASLKHEAKIAKHLAAQLAPEHLGYKPTEKQRTTLELLQYLTIIGEAAAVNAVTGTWDHWDALEKRSQAVDLASFPKAMDLQVRNLGKLLAGFSDQALKKKQAKTWAGQKLSLGATLVETTLKGLTAYRMQLFLYAKAAGLHQLATSDLWAGKKPKAAAMA